MHGGRRVCGASDRPRGGNCRFRCGGGTMRRATPSADQDHARHPRDPAYAAQGSRPRCHHRQSRSRS
jgi:hypothetical protein